LELDGELLKVELCAPELPPDVDWLALAEELGCELLVDVDWLALAEKLGCELLKVELWAPELLSDTDWLALAEELLVDGPEVLYVLDGAADSLELSWDEEEETDAEAEDEE
jgi:hypothetical protein